MKLRWSETARTELDDVFVYLLTQSPFSAKTVAMRIVRRARLLASFPFAGHPTDMPGVRSLSIVRYPYVVLYTIDTETQEVVIRNIRHTARKKPAAE